MANFAAPARLLLMLRFIRGEVKADRGTGSRRRLWMWGLIVLAFCTFQGLLYIPQTYLLNIRANPSFTLGSAIVATFIPFYLYALLIRAKGLECVWMHCVPLPACHRHRGRMRRLSRRVPLSRWLTFRSYEHTWTTRLADLVT